MSVISPAKKRMLHRRVAQALESAFAGDIDAVSAQLAMHYEHCGLAEQSVGYYRHAAEVMHRRFAYPEVVSLIKRGRLLLPSIKDSVQRDELELALLSMLGICPVGSMGLQVSEQLEMLTKAESLSRQLGKPSDPSILRTLAINHILTTNFGRAREIGEQLLTLSEQASDKVLMVEGHYVLGAAHSPIGAFQKSHEYFDLTIRNYNPQYATLHLARFTWDPKVICLCRDAINLWCMGYPDAALQSQQLSLAYAEALGHSFSLAYSRFYGALLQYLLGDAAAVEREAMMAMKVSREHGHEFWLRRGAVLHGWSLAARGQVEAGLAEMEMGAASIDALGIQVLKGLTANQIAEHYAVTNQFERAMTLIEMALADLADNPNSELWYEAELNRMIGDLVLGKDSARAEEAYRRAIAIAKRQSAKSLELRATLRLTRLCHSQGRTDEAQSVLTPIFSWFTEGFETPDLKEARALLQKITFG